MHKPPSSIMCSNLVPYQLDWSVALKFISDLNQYNIEFRLFWIYNFEINKKYIFYLYRHADTKSHIRTMSQYKWSKPGKVQELSDQRLNQQDYKSEDIFDVRQTVSDTRQWTTSQKEFLFWLQPCREQIYLTSLSLLAWSDPWAQEPAAADIKTWASITLHHPPKDEIKARLANQHPGVFMLNVLWNCFFAESSCHEVAKASQWEDTGTHDHPWLRQVSLLKQHFLFLQMMQHLCSSNWKSHNN